MLTSLRLLLRLPRLLNNIFRAGYFRTNTDYIFSIMEALLETDKSLLFKQRFFCGVMVCCLVHKVQMPCQRYLFCGFVYTRHFLMNASTNGSDVSVRLVVSIAFFAEIYQPAKRVVGLQQGRIAHHYQAFARTRHGHIELTVYDAARALVYIFIVGEEL